MKSQSVRSTRAATGFSVESQSRARVLEGENAPPCRARCLSQTSFEIARVGARNTCFCARNVWTRGRNYAAVVIVQRPWIMITSQYQWSFLRKVADRNRRAAHREQMRASDPTKRTRKSATRGGNSCSRCLNSRLCA